MGIYDIGAVSGGLSVAAPLALFLTSPFNAHLTFPAPAVVQVGNPDLEAFFSSCSFGEDTQKSTFMAYIGPRGESGRGSSSGSEIQGDLYLRSLGSPGGVQSPGGYGVGSWPPSPQPPHERLSLNLPPASGNMLAVEAGYVASTSGISDKLPDLVINPYGRMVRVSTGTTCLVPHLQSAAAARPDASTNADIGLWSHCGGAGDTIWAWRTNGDHQEMEKQQQQQLLRQGGIPGAGEGSSTSDATSLMNSTSSGWMLSSLWGEASSSDAGPAAACYSAAGDRQQLQQGMTCLRSAEAFLSSFDSLEGITPHGQDEETAASWKLPRNSGDRAETDLGAEEAPRRLPESGPCHPQPQPLAVAACLSDIDSPLQLLLRRKLAEALASGEGSPDSCSSSSAVPPSPSSHRVVSGGRPELDTRSLEPGQGAWLHNNEQQQPGRWSSSPASKPNSSLRMSSGSFPKAMPRQPVGGRTRTVPSAASTPGSAGVEMLPASTHSSPSHSIDVHIQHPQQHNKHHLLNDVTATAMRGPKCHQGQPSLLPRQQPWSYEI